MTKVGTPTVTNPNSHQASMPCPKFTPINSRERSTNPGIDTPSQELDRPSHVTVENRVHDTSSVTARIPSMTGRLYVPLRWLAAFASADATRKPPPWAGMFAIGNGLVVASMV